MINWDHDNDEHHETVIPACEEDKAEMTNEVKEHVEEYKNSVNNCLLEKFSKLSHEIKEENFDKMADGKLLKCYMKLNSYKKKLALVQEYQNQYF